MTRPDFSARARQLRKVAGCLKGSRWWSLAALSRASGAPEASASARIRDLRAKGWRIEKVRMPNNLYYYRGTP